MKNDEVAEKAKGLLLQDCKFCEHYISKNHPEDGLVEFCKIARAQGFSRMIYVRNKNRYGVSYLEIPGKRTCDSFSS